MKSATLRNGKYIVFKLPYLVTRPDKRKWNPDFKDFSEYYYTPDQREVLIDD